MNACAYALENACMHARTQPDLNVMYVCSHITWSQPIVDHVSVENEVEFKGKLRFADSIDITADSTSILISASSNSITTVNIGETADKDLKIAGLSAEYLNFTTGYFSIFEDENNSARFIDSSSSSVIETLAIAGSLKSQKALTAPSAIDVDDINYFIDPSGDSKLYSLEILEPATAEQIRLSKLTIDTENKSNDTVILDANFLTVIKNDKVSFTGTSIFENSTIHIKQSKGLKISDASSSPSSTYLTPGDLDVLIHGKNADSLHRHDRFGDIANYDLARRDIDNSQTSNTSTKALFGTYIMTSPGLVISVQPDSDSDTKPLFAVYSESGSLRMGALSTGLVIATIFKGSGAEISNITGSAIEDGTIGANKIKNDSLVSRIFADNIVTLPPLP